MRENNTSDCESMNYRRCTQTAHEMRLGRILQTESWKRECFKMMSVKMANAKKKEQEISRRERASCVITTRRLKDARCTSGRRSREYRYSV